MSRLTTLAAALLLAALPLAVTTAQAPKAAQPAASSGSVRPGTYDLDLAIGGGTIQGSLALTASGDSLTGALHVADHDVPVRNLTRTGSRLTFDAGGEGMKVSYDIKFAGDSISGSFIFNGDPGFVTGKRRK
jgi:hypothetical protein